MSYFKSINLKDSSGKEYIVRVVNNQKLIQVHRDKGINFETNYTAIKNLSANAYILYMYILMHNPNRVWALSTKEICENTHLKKYTYTEAMKELQEHQYLIEAPIKLSDESYYSYNTYHLFENPKIRPQL